MNGRTRIGRELQVDKYYKIKEYKVADIHGLSRPEETRFIRKEYFVNNIQEVLKIPWLKKRKDLKQFWYLGRFFGWAEKLSGPWHSNMATSQCNVCVFEKVRKNFCQNLSCGSREKCRRNTFCWQLFGKKTVSCYNVDYLPFK